jgi:hypothetical protein
VCTSHKAAKPSAHSCSGGQTTLVLVRPGKPIQNRILALFFMEFLPSSNLAMETRSLN